MKMHFRAAGKNAWPLGRNETEPRRQQGSGGERGGVPSPGVGGHVRGHGGEGERDRCSSGLEMVSSYPGIRLAPSPLQKQPVLLITFNPRDFSVD